ncbi:MAG: amidohydrolase family protein [Phycisphaerae bacterium]|nr:amidohydrolase family protein [Phycisphaerae bacterium]
MASGKIDLHTHILPERWPNLRQRFGYGGWVELEHTGLCCARMQVDGRFFREIDSNCWDPARRISDCDRFGVSMQVLSTVPILFSYWARAADALVLARLLNDHIADVCRTRPDRFAGLGTVPLQDPALAITELERCMGELGLRGVQIGTHVNHWNLDAPELFPFFQRCAELGAAVFVHPWDMMGQDAMSKYWLPWLVGMPAESSRAITSMIFGGVFARLPSLKVCFAHGGGSFPFTLGRIEHGFRERPDLCAIDNAISPRETLGRLWFDSLVHDIDSLRFLLRLVGAERIALGTDYPFPLGEREPGRLIEAMTELTNAERARLLFGTATEFLNLPSS